MKQKEKVYTYVVDEPEKGDLRWKEYRMEEFKKKSFGRTEYVTKTEKVLQQFTGTEWKSIPSSYEFVSFQK